MQSVDWHSSIIVNPEGDQPLLGCMPSFVSKYNTINNKIPVITVK